ncbi:NLR family CARD domain-containing protein 4-like [Branchiostoma lanceolatum]|uniref:NLR family CARD domain-containing protein 4-like n=1 Tax=Branchiostoma lanceolatum TaxID=7740 RepID=UPI00345703C4
MPFSLVISLQGKVSIQMKQDSGKVRTAEEEVVKIFKKLGGTTAFEIKKDPNGDERVHLTIEGTFEGVTTIDQKIDVSNVIEGEFKRSVKDHCKTRLKTFKPLIWNDDFQLTYSDIFTELDLIQTYGKQHKVYKQNLWSDEQEGKLNSLDDVLSLNDTRSSAAQRVILVEGEAGVGKTTFLSKEAIGAVAKKTVLGKRHDIVLLIRLREVRKGETIENIVLDQCYPDTDQCFPVEEILRNNKSKVLFLLDGYDELLPRARTDEQAIPRLLSGKKYPDSMIVITSRPSAGVQKYLQPDYHLRIMGFSREHVDRYISQYFTVRRTPELAGGLIAFLKETWPVTDLMYTPIFLMLVCVLWEEDPSIDSPRTMTELYSELLTCLVKKHCKREGVRLPTGELPSNVAKSLRQLGELALKAMLRNETLIDYAKVKKKDVNWELLLNIGVVCLEESASKLHPRKQYNFSHKTMQEFLAGRYFAHALVKQVKQGKQVNQEEGNRGIDKMMQLMSTSVTKTLEYGHQLQFTCGCHTKAARTVLDKLSHLSRQEFSNFLTNVVGKREMPYLSSKRSFEEYRSFVLLCLDILNERKEPEVLKAVSKALPLISISLKESSNVRRIKQQAALKYYLENIQHLHLRDRVILSISKIGTEEALRYLDQTFTSPIEGLRLDLGLRHVTFSTSDQTAKLASVLEKVPQLRALELSWAGLAPSSLKSLVEGFRHMSELEELDLVMNRKLGNDGIKVLHVKLSSVPHLTILRLSHVDMTTVGMSTLAPSMGCLMKLTELDVSHNEIGDAGLESLTTVLQYFTEMRVLLIAGIGISTKGMRTLVPALCLLTKLSTLDISENDIGDAGLECLADKFQGHKGVDPLYLKDMKVLKLVEIGIGNSGISALAKVLAHLVNFQVLDVSNNDIGDSGIFSLVQAFFQPSRLHRRKQSAYGSLQELHIGRNKEVTEAGLEMIVEPIGTLQSLTWLDMSGGDYAETYDTVAMSGTYIHLPDAPAQTLARSLSRLVALERLDLWNIKLGLEGFQAMTKAATEHPKLQELHYDEELVPEGADTTASCLKLYGG